jgi:hypothetical protein
MGELWRNWCALDAAKALDAKVVMVEDVVLCITCTLKCVSFLLGRRGSEERVVEATVSEQRTILSRSLIWEAYIIFNFLIPLTAALFGHQTFKAEPKVPGTRLAWDQFRPPFPFVHIIDPLHQLRCFRMAHSLYTPTLI